jgi:putative ATPase
MPQETTEDLLLFPKETNQEVSKPLAELLRPRQLAEVIGHEAMLGPSGTLRKMAEQKALRSLIFWGPPGCGKTSLAYILAQESGAAWHALSGVTTGAVELKTFCERAHMQFKAGKLTVLFIDEIHRLNRAQQEVLLPYTESGAVILMGATTENPSFALTKGLLSRCMVFTLELLTPANLEQLLQKAEAHYQQPLPLDAEARQDLIALAAGDGRFLLSSVEQVYLQAPQQPLTRAELLRILQKHRPLYDAAGDGHYMLISALHKSVRGSDVDAALYWLARMLEGGEDRLYLLRRMLRMASEDIGLADPAALTQVTSAFTTYQQLGSPEGELAIAQAVIYLASAPKSNSVYMAYKAAMSLAKDASTAPPPPYAINAATDWMAAQGFGANYIYDHDTAEGCAGQNYFPEKLSRRTLYQPVARGYEREITKHLDYYARIRARKST